MNLARRQVSYPVTLTNSGNGVDTFNLGFTQSGAFSFTSVVSYADANCDGVADTAFSNANIAAGAAPGACVRYRVTITNIGRSSVLSVVVSDATPANTSYSAAVAAAISQGSITAPAAGSNGTVSASVGTLAAGASAVMSFGVRINP